MKDVEIAKVLRVSEDTIERVRKRFVEEGLEAAINRKKQINRKAKKLDGVKEANLIKIACSEAPEGASRWTLQLLSDKLVELNIVDSIAKETVRQSMKQLGRKRPSFIGCLTSSAQLHAYPFVVTDFLHIA